MDRFKKEYMPFVDRMAEVIEATFAGTVLDMVYVDEDVIWIAQNGAVYIDRTNAPAYISDAIKRLGTTYDLDVSFIKELNPDCLSITGRISFGKHHHTFEEVDVCYHASWIKHGNDWKLKHIATSSGKRIFRSELEERGDFDLGLLYDKLPAGIVGCENNDALTVQMMNPVMFELLDYEDLDDVKDKIGSSLYGLVHPDDFAKMQDFVRDIREGGSRDITTIRLRKRDFSYVWVQFTGSVFQNGLLVLLGMDYTQQYQANQQLHKENKIAMERGSDYRKILENTPGGFHCCNMFEPVHVNYVSDSLCQITGYTSKEILEDMKGIYIELIVPEDREEFVKSAMRMMEYPHVERTSYRLLTKDGRKIPVIDIGQSVRSDDGKMYAYSTVQEIEPFTDTFQPTTNTEESHVSRLLASTPLGLCLYKFNGKKLSVEYVNESFMKKFGYDISQYAELSNDKSFPLMLNEDIPIMEASLNELQHGGSTASGRGRMHGVNGTVWVEYNLLLMNREENGNITLAAYYTDISEEMNKKAETGPRVEVHAFGYFNVTVDGNAVHFKSAKAKELLAILVDFRGAFVSQGALISRLWEDDPVNKLTLARLRKTFKNLMDELKVMGIDDIVESESGQRRIIPEKIYCDYFSYFTGKPQYQHLYQGSYMLDYTWAEVTSENLNRMKEEQLNKKN